MTNWNDFSNDPRLGGNPGLNGQQPIQHSALEQILTVIGWLYFAHLLFARYKNSTRRAHQRFWLWLLTAAFDVWMLWIALDHHPGTVVLSFLVLFGFVWCPIAALYTLHPAKSGQR